MNKPNEITTMLADAIKEAEAAMYELSVAINAAKEYIGSPNTEETGKLNIRPGRPNIQPLSVKDILIRKLDQKNQYNPVTFNYTKTRLRRNNLPTEATCYHCGITLYPANMYPSTKGHIYCPNHIGTMGIETLKEYETLYTKETR